MAGVAYDSLPITESAKSGYVSYTWTYETKDSDGDWDRDSSGSGTTEAIVNGTVKASNTKVFVGGKAVVVKGDQTDEHWVAGSMPTHGHGASSPSASPGKSGSGSGTVSIGSSTVFIGGKAVAFDGADVKTTVGSTSKINGGSTTVFVN
ncbi:hypothetical protein [Paenibacillus sp. Mc5Re-14]|uniref:hypothetical protein n=1 Tax=Paenibacillus sp. Mc5Re-14 TaxID=1030529 RepID=UPI000AE702BE|nr:hypothetical protein [Paenibacillus sp. Mc5Re-14]